MVTVGEHLLQRQSCLFKTASTSEGLSHPETARAKRPLVTVQPIVCGFFWIIAMDKRIGGQFPLNTVTRVLSTTYNTF
jgi:hypothetical protein